MIRQFSGSAGGWVFQSAVVATSHKGVTCRNFRWKLSFLVVVVDGSFGVDLDLMGGIDISTSETSEVPPCGSKSMELFGWASRAFPFPFAIPFGSRNWEILGLCWDSFKRDGAGTSSLSVMTIGSAFLGVLMSGLTWILDRFGAVGLATVVDFLAV